MNLYSCLAVLAQRWLEPEKPLKKQIKGTWLPLVPENSLFFSGKYYSSKIHLLYICIFFYTFKCIPVHHLMGNMSPIELWTKIAPSTLVICNWLIFLGRSRIALLSELQSTILHLWSQLTAAWADKVSRRASVCVCVCVCFFLSSIVLHYVLMKGTHSVRRCCRVDVHRDRNGWAHRC